MSLITTTRPILEVCRLPEWARRSVWSNVSLPLSLIKNLPQVPCLTLVDLMENTPSKSRIGLVESTSRVVILDQSRTAKNRNLRWLIYVLTYTWPRQTGQQNPSFFFLATLPGFQGSWCKFHVRCLYIRLDSQSVALRSTLTGRGAYHFKNTYSPITLANILSINLVSIFRCSSPPSNPVYVSRVDPLTLVFSLSSYRQSYISLVYSSRFIDLQHFFFIKPAGSRPF
jgi:hypothetical protein